MAQRGALVTDLLVERGRPSEVINSGVNAPSEILKNHLELLGLTLSQAR